MRGKLTFLAGLAVGYVLGARAGRERYEQITRTARRLRDNPTVQEATGVIQAQALRLVSTGRNAVAVGTTRVTGRLADRLSHTRLGERLWGGGQETEPYVSSLADSALNEAHPGPNGAGGH